jgi:hypothetical protein
MNFNIFSRQCKTCKDEQRTAASGDDFPNTPISCGNRFHRTNPLYGSYNGSYHLCGSCGDGPNDPHTVLCATKCAIFGDMHLPNVLGCPTGYKIKVTIPPIHFPDGELSIPWQPGGEVEGFVRHCGACPTSANINECRWSDAKPSSHNPLGSFTLIPDNPRHAMAYIGNYPVYFELKNHVTGSETIVNKMAVFAQLGVVSGWDEHNYAGRYTVATIIIAPFVWTYGAYTHMDLGSGGAGFSWMFRGDSITRRGCGCVEPCDLITCEAEAVAPNTWYIAKDHHSRPDPDDINNAEYWLDDPRSSLGEATVEIIGTDEEALCHPPEPHGCYGNAEPVYDY